MQLVLNACCNNFANPKKFLNEGHWEGWLEVKDTSDTAVFNKQWDSF